jgi:hypothetical protein
MAFAHRDRRGYNVRLLRIDEEPIMDQLDRARIPEIP